MDEVHLTDQEANDLVLSILEGVDFAEGRALALRESWVPEMQNWALLLLDRIHGLEGDDL